MQLTRNCLSATKNTVANPHKAREPNKQQRTQSKKRTGLLLILFITKIIHLMTNILIRRTAYFCVITNKILI